MTTNAPNLALLSAIRKRGQGSQGWHWTSPPTKEERAALAHVKRLGRQRA